MQFNRLTSCLEITPEYKNYMQFCLNRFNIYFEYLREIKQETEYNFELIA